MKINSNITFKEIALWEIPDGECFMSDNNIYMKCSNTGVNQSVKVVDLQSGKIESFHEMKIINPIMAEINLTI